MPSWGKPATAKHQRWPKSGGSNVERYLNARRDQQQIVLVCGVDGCKQVYGGLFGQARLELGLHRSTEHPDWTAPKRKSKGKW